MKFEIFVVGPFQENTVVVWDETSRKCFVIDPGGDNQRIRRFMEERRLLPQAIVNTHGHIDHIAGARELQDALNIPFMLHKGDEMVLEVAEGTAAYFGVSFPGAPRIDAELNDGQILALDETTLTVIHTPGHTPGGVCLLCGEDIFVGDTLFAGSVGRTDLPGGSEATLIESIFSRLLTLPDATRVHPGHGPSTTIGRERRSNPFLQD